ncbi:MAG: ribonuclease Z [Deltaproteobacteria bacterium]|nr:ribonuclease Z [Deltaproteobacteria bacterium]
MKSSFRPSLVNGPFQDCALYVALRWQGDALLFDLGRLDRLNAAQCLRLSHVFVSHTHMDHFMGFDQLLRLTLPRDRELTVCGPPGLIDNIAGKLAGYTWNLTENYLFRLNVVERHDTQLARARFRAASGFAREPLPDEPCAPGGLVTTREFRIETATLDHRIPCLAFAVVEPRHLNVRPAALQARGFRPGPWLSRLKEAIRAGDDAAPIAIPSPDVPVTIDAGTLRRELVDDHPGQRIAYVVDTLFEPTSAARVAGLARAADVFYCEARFLDVDRDEAEKRHHLTARQAGFLARAAGVRRLEVFHFSPRYQGMAQAFHAEARAEWTGATRLEDEVPWAATLVTDGPARPSVDEPGNDGGT